MSRSLKKVEDEISEYNKAPFSPHITHTHTHTHTHTLQSHTHTLTGEKYGCEAVAIIPVDFSDGMEIYQNIAERLNDLDVGILGMHLGHSAKIHH
jgi:hypothetical protein